MSASFNLAADRREVLAGAGAGMLMASPIGALAADRKAAATGRNIPFDNGWRFYRGEGEGFETPACDDTSWRAVDLPHDWSIEDLAAAPGEAGSRIIGPFDKQSAGGTATGFTVGGDGWYRKRFRLPGGKAPGRVEILFEGVYSHSEVWLNGQRVGAHPSGYTPFALDLTPFLSPDGDNLIAVHVRNRGQNSRWYSGSGIYRHVWLDILPERARINRWGVGVVTRRLTAAGAELEIATALDDLGEGLTLVSRIVDADGRKLWEEAVPAKAAVVQKPVLRAPRLWSPTKPTLYVLETQLRRGTTILDSSVTEFGIRIVIFDPQRGMTINGTPTKLRGGCLHHDNGLLGAAAFDAAEERKVALLKARGYNAIRGSHNPYSPAFMRACDRHGMLLISEAFDAWLEPKLPQDYAADFNPNWRADIAAMVDSQRNHPSIIVWSIGNEIPGRNKAEGVRIQWELANEIHRRDPSRPVTAAINDFPGRPVTASVAAAPTGQAGVTSQTSTVFLDIAGYNYKLSDYEHDHQYYPKRILYGSESFPRDVFAIWDLTDRSPWLIGDFVWTAMDYLGEAGIGGSSYSGSKTGLSLGSWPWVGSFCGDIDIVGRQKAPSLARDVVWGLSPLEITVQKPVPDGKYELIRPWGWSDERASWTWPGAEGKPLAVRVYTAGDQVELHLDGKLIETKPVTATELKHIEFQIPYAAGTLEVVAFRTGKEIARRRLATAGTPAGITVTPERVTGGSARGDVSYVAIELVDTQGRYVGDVQRPLTISIEGPGELAAFGSADPFARGSFKSSSAQSWDGRALAIVRGTGADGTVRIAVRGDGLKPGFATIKVGGLNHAGGTRP